MKIGSKLAVIVAVAAWFEGAAAAGNLPLHFRISLEQAPNPFMPDTFRAIAADRSDARKGYDPLDVLQPPGPPTGDYLQAMSTDTGRQLTIDYRPFDPTAPDVTFPIDIVASGQNPGVSGAVVFELTNSELLEDTNAEWMVYLKRYEAGGAFAGKLDLRTSQDHKMRWLLSDAKGTLAAILLIIREPCAAADLDGSGVVTLADLELMAADWHASLSRPAADLDGDDKVDLSDLLMLADNWLCDCRQN